MRAHEELRERLHAYRDGELPPVESRAVADHLKGCPECAAELERWERVAGALLKGRRTASSEAFVGRVMARIAEEELAEAPAAQTLGPAAQTLGPAGGVWWLAPAFALAAGLLALLWPWGSAPLAEGLLLSGAPSWAFGSQPAQADDVLVVALGEQP